MDVIKVLGNSIARRDGVSCQETPLLEGMDIIKLLADLVTRVMENIKLGGGMNIIEGAGRLIFWEGCT